MLHPSSYLYSVFLCAYDGALGRRALLHATPPQETVRSPILRAALRADGRSPRRAVFATCLCGLDATRQKHLVLLGHPAHKAHALFGIIHVFGVGCLPFMNLFPIKKLGAHRKRVRNRRVLVLATLRLLREAPFDAGVIPQPCILSQWRHKFIQKNIL